jgi:hypothetical protein
VEGIPLALDDLQVAGRAGQVGGIVPPVRRQAARRQRRRLVGGLRQQVGETGMPADLHPHHQRVQRMEAVGQRGGIGEHRGAVVRRAAEADDALLQVDQHERGAGGVEGGGVEKEGVNG